MTSRLKEEMQEAGRRSTPYASEKLTAETGANAAYAVVEPLLRDVVAASKRHRFLPDLDRAIARVETALAEP